MLASILIVSVLLVLAFWRIVWYCVELDERAETTRMKWYDRDE